MSLSLSDLFTAPWPGPGDSEGPVDPDQSIVPTAARLVVPGLGPEAGPLHLMTTAPWPGPGDSEGPVDGESETALPESTPTHRSPLGPASSPTAPGRPTPLSSRRTFGISERPAPAFEEACSPDILEGYHL